jgi:hypothetical protein
MLPMHVHLPPLCSIVYLSTCSAFALQKTFVCLNDDNAAVAFCFLEDLKGSVLVKLLQSRSTLPLSACRDEA